MQVKNKIIKLSANENFYGCSPKVFKTFSDKYNIIHMYSDDFNILEEKLAEKYGVLPDNVVVSSGSARIIEGFIQTLVKPDEEVLTFEKSFIAYGRFAKLNNRKCHFAKTRNLICDVEALFPLINNKTRVIFIANPNNPTGTIVSHIGLIKLMEKISPSILVVVDEAYCDYVSDENYPDSFEIQKKFPNLFILRTFSKIYGLAGLRIGYAVGESEIISKLKETRIPHFFNSFAAEAAIAALNDHNFIRICAEKNAVERDFLYKELCNIGCKTIPSQANFFYIYFDTDEQKEKVFKNFYDEGMLIFNLKLFGMEKSLRISIANRDVNNKIIEIFRKIIF